LLGWEVFFASRKFLIAASQRFFLHCYGIVCLCWETNIVWSDLVCVRPLIPLLVAAWLPFQVLHAPASNKNALKALVAAEYVGVKLELAPSFQMGVTNKSPEFLNLNPLGKVHKLVFYSLVVYFCSFFCCQFWDASLGALVHVNLTNCRPFCM
jgi:hypothetical protein